MRKQLVDELAPLRENALEGHPWRDWAEAQEEASAKGQRLPGATSRWNRGKDLSWEPLRPERVCEVAYDHMQGTRFRHAAQFVRWRPDKRPEDCRYDQLEVTPAYELERVFGARDGARAGSKPAPGIVVGIGRLLGGALVLRDVAQVDADARPGARAAAHRVDEDVVHLRAAPRPPDGAPSSARGRRARPPCARAFATVMSGWRRLAPAGASRLARAFRRDGATRGGSPCCFL